MVNIRISNSTKKLLVQILTFLKEETISQDQLRLLYDILFANESQPADLKQFLIANIPEMIRSGDLTQGRVRDILFNWVKQLEWNIDEREILERMAGREARDRAVREAVVRENDRAINNFVFDDREILQRIEAGREARNREILENIRARDRVAVARPYNEQEELEEERERLERIANREARNRALREAVALQEAREVRQEPSDSSPKRRKSPKRKSPLKRRKSPKRKSPKRKSPLKRRK